MGALRMNKKRMLYVCLAAVVAYLLLRVRPQSAQFQVFIANSRPIDVWEFVADFSNVKSINPIIIDFNILGESGNYEHWQYSAEYTEHMYMLPSIQQATHSHFNIRPDGKDYVILGTHTTCFFSMGCFASESEIRFTSDGNGTRCVEKILFDCPAAFSVFCRSEVAVRQNVLDNLKKVFLKKSVLANKI